MQKSNFYHIILLCLCVFITSTTRGQSSQEKIPIKQVIDDLSDTHQVQFNYKSDLLEGIIVFPLSRKRTLAQNLQYLESETSLRFTKVGSSIFTITKTYTICGYLKDVALQEPLPGATIIGGSKNVVTDSEGYFEFEITSLEKKIEIRFLGLKTIQEKATFFYSENCRDYLMLPESEVMEAIVLQGYLVRGIDKKSDGSTVINYAEFTTLPGLIETDVLQTVQALPGVLSIDETVSNINIRGGSHDQNLILWDDIKMYQSGHFFGLISSFNPQTTHSATIITNGTDASYGDGVSGSILMNTDTEVQKEFEGSAGVNFISADVYLDLPVGKNSSVQIAGRRSIDDIYRTPTYETYFGRVTQETEVENNVQSVRNSNQNFSFYDTSIRWLFNPSEKDRIKLNFILFNNDLTFDETSSTDVNLESRESTLRQNTIAAGINYERDWTAQFTTNLHIYNTDYTLRALNSNIILNQSFLQENSVSETGVKAEGIYKWNATTLESGYQFTETEIVNVNDIDVPRFLRRDSEVLKEHSVFVQGIFNTVVRDLSLIAGVRGNYIQEFNEFLIEPRVSARKKIGNHFQIEALGELKHQNTSQIVNFQNDFLGIEKRRWQLADADSIPILKSKQASLGLEYSQNGWLIDGTGYYKEVDGITTQSQSFTTKYEFEKTSGEYAIFGMDFLLRKQLKNLSSWLSYSYMDNIYNFRSLEEGEFASNFETTHSFTLGATYIYENFTISTGLNYRTGKPTSTPLLGNEIIDEEINFGVANSSRLADYYRLDASALYNVNLSEKCTVELGASIWNALNRDNTINNYYRITTDGTPRKFSRESLGLTTNFMMRVKF